MKLYGYWRSSSSWRVRIALNHKGVKWDYVAVNLIKDGGEQYKPDYQVKNAMSQVPLLEWEEGGQTKRLAQSMAIIEYLDETIPNPSILPKDPFLRAQTRMLAEIVNSGIQPLQNAAVLKKVKELAGGVEHSDANWAREWLERGLRGMETSVKPLAGKYCVGDSVTLPDFYLVPQMYSARRFKVDLAPFPTLARIDAALCALPAFKSAHADNQPDTPPAEKK
ncbi:MAG: maleylacetoacetate isomerase [Deltaproteobacteria bacterium]|nr:maleylacetoacetate isomerase [Deltaproteobacteria bacterium]